MAAPTTDGPQWPSSTCSIRRYDPESGEAPYWDEHTIELEPHRSVLEGILQAKARFDGSIGIRCSCRAAICGSCGVRDQRPARPRLPHAPRRRRWRAPEDGVIEVEPMGNMPVIKDLIVDMDAVHWKKIQRVTPWLINKEPIPEREYIVAARVDGRRHAVDGLHPVRRLRLGLPLDGGRPAVHRPGRAGQGLPLRRRPARRQARASASRTSPRTSTASTLHALLQVHRGLPEGRRPDEPDHAPAAHRRQRLRHRGPQQRLPPRARVRRRTSSATGCCTRPTCCRDSYGGKFQPARRARARRLAAGDHARRCCAAR